MISPSTQSVQAFVFGLNSDTEAHKRAILVDPDEEAVHLDGEKRQSMYVELLDGT
jgi:hypothetical protein